MWMQHKMLLLWCCPWLYMVPHQVSELSSFGLLDSSCSPPEVIWSRQYRSAAKPVYWMKIFFVGLRRSSAPP
jgi:hypothetical protein